MGMNTSRRALTWPLTANQQHLISAPIRVFMESGYAFHIKGGPGDYYLSSLDFTDGRVGYCIDPNTWKWRQNLNWRPTS